MKNHFQKKLQQDITTIRISDKIMEYADKTNNMCRLSKDQHNMFLNNFITSTYKNQIRISTRKSTSTGETF